ncbi:MAG: YdcF family protein, partial [Micromonosporaceae bacterium]|nr:YdcF family protein [Micromonosporaceae bacterium]
MTIPSIGPRAMRRLGRWLGWVRRRPFRFGSICLAAVMIVLVGPSIWLRAASAGHRYTAVARAPSADVVIVSGAQLMPGGKQPKPFLASRLRTTAGLIREGRARAVLVSGDGHSAAGSETEVMRAFLIDLDDLFQGVDLSRNQWCRSACRSSLKHGRV